MPVVEGPETVPAARGAAVSPATPPAMKAAPAMKAVPPGKAGSKAMKVMKAVPKRTPKPERAAAEADKPPKAMKAMKATKASKTDQTEPESPQRNVKLSRKRAFAQLADLNTPAEGDKQVHLLAKYGKATVAGHLKAAEGHNNFLGCPSSFGCRSHMSLYVFKVQQGKLLYLYVLSSP